MNLPPDPDNLNDERSNWAQHAVDAFGEITGTSSAGEDDETIMGDLLCDLMHWCDRNGVDFATKLLGAEINYAAETAA